MTPTYLRVPVMQLRPNSWNPNQMDPEQYSKARNSIRRFGFIDPITVRQNPDPTPYEIIDGENRWLAAQDEKLVEVDIADLGVVSDHVAEQLTVILNELRGTYDPKKMGVLLTGLVAAEPLPKLLEVMPFTKLQFEELAQLPTVDWGSIGGGGGHGSGSRSEKWVERVYRMTVEAAAKLDEAIVSWRDREGEDSGATPDWKVLQAIAEEFLNP